MIEMNAIKTNDKRKRQRIRFHSNNEVIQMKEKAIIEIEIIRKFLYI
jgi:hypothetical protein